MFLFRGVFFYLLASLITARVVLPTVGAVIFLLFASVGSGYYWESKREGYWLKGIITCLIMGPFATLLIGFSIDRISFFASSKNPALLNELMIAAVNQKPDIIMNLIAGGAKVNKKTPSKRTALMIAAESNRYPQSVAALISGGALINAVDKEGMTALMWGAKLNKNSEICEVLLKAGADANYANKKGVTALMLAAYGNPNPCVVDALLKGGANPKILDKEGKSVFDYAYQIPNQDLIDSSIFDKLRKVALLIPKEN